jgi:hypothetical protein
MEAALITLVGALVGHLVTVHFKTKERRAAQLKALAGFLDSIAECLEEMQKDLSSYIVPTAAGNRVKTLIREYEQVIDGSGINERTRAALGGVLLNVRRCLVEGKAEDDILRGYVLRSGEKERADLLAELLRTAANLRGEAEAIRAKAT